MEKIDLLKEGIGMTGETMKSGKRSPTPAVNGRELYRRIFIRLRTPAEVLTCSPIEDGRDFADRVSIIEQWFNAHIRGSGNFILTFDAMQVTDEEADKMMCATEKGDEK